MSKCKVVTEVKTITPVLATEWLNKNTHNRPIRNRSVKEYAEQMKKGLWQLNGESIVFDKNDVLLDGQHRLWACIDADTDFKSVVTTGVDPEAFATIDTGTKRSASDVLYIAGVTQDQHTIAAAAAVVLKYKRGDVLTDVRQPSRQEVLEFVQTNPELAIWCADAKRKTAWTNAYASNVAAVMFLGANKHPVKAKTFLHGFITGEGLAAGSPVLTLRNRLATDKRLPKRVRLAMIVMAWNALVANKTLMKMMPPRGDSFPKIAGAA